jgi:Putative F0F1-ATPase subunit Ca2+/Mg2+ transporter
VTASDHGSGADQGSGADKGTGGAKGFNGDEGPGAVDLISLGVTMAILVGGGLGLGLLVDDWLHSSPIATFVGLFLGVAFAGLALWERARRYL